MKRSKDFEVRRLYRLLGELVPYSMIENFNFSGWIYEGKILIYHSLGITMGLIMWFSQISSVF